MTFASRLPYLLVHKDIVSNVDSWKKSVVVFHHVSTFYLDHLSPIRELHFFFISIGLYDRQPSGKESRVDRGERIPGKNG